MHASREDHCAHKSTGTHSRAPLTRETLNKKVLTPPNIKRPSTRKTIRHNLQHIIITPRLRQVREPQQHTLQRRRPDTKEHEYIHDEELVVPGHDLVVDRGECDNGLCLFRDEKEDEGDEEGEEGDEDGREEGLDEFFLPRVGLEVVVL